MGFDTEVQKMKNSEICSICGYEHSTTELTCLVITKHVSNKRVESKARLSLPDELIINNMADGSNRVLTRFLLPKGTRFGPLEAKKSFSLNPAIQFPIKIFPCDREEFLEYYLDTSDEEFCTWMMFVEPADSFEEQNLICYQEKCNIYFATVKEVKENECLKVWYGQHYAEKMGKHLLQKPSKSQEATDNLYSISEVNKLMNLQQQILQRDSWTCKFCGGIKVNVIEFANHIIEHYMAQLRKTCETCKATFNSRKSLRKHVNLIHTPHTKKNKYVAIEGPETSLNQTALKELSIGGPLLNNLEVDNIDNSDFLIPTSNHFDEDLREMGAENLIVDNLLTENVRSLDHFNFEIGECQEEFVCDICVKSFSKLRYLIQHLKRYTGEYFCFYCKKIFCRKESLVHHACINGADLHCAPCGRSFLQMKYYKRHVEAVHNEKFKCAICKHNYCNKYELDRHNCKSGPDTNQNFFCAICRKSFKAQQNLKKHMLRSHSSKSAKNFMCDICPKQYFDKYSRDLHMKTHGNDQIQCDICKKKFYRKDVYFEHMQLHDDKEWHCNICNKKFKSKKNLSCHKISHEEAKFKCVTCSMRFKTKSNLTKHLKSHLKPLRSTDLMSNYVCPYCAKKVKLRSSLVRHINRTHPECKDVHFIKKTSKAARKVQDSVTLSDEPEINSFPTDTDLAMITNTKNNMDLMNDAEMNELENNLQIQMIDNILLNTTKEMGIEISDDLSCLDNIRINSCISTSNGNGPSNDRRTVENREVCLSMPDLMEHDQDITLGENAYIMDNGDIIEHKANSENNVVVYLFNQPKI